MAWKNAVALPRLLMILLTLSVSQLHCIYWF